MKDVSMNTEIETKLDGATTLILLLCLESLKEKSVLEEYLNALPKGYSVTKLPQQTPRHLAVVNIF